MHVRALAWWRCPLCSASYGISPFCTAFPHLQPYFFFKHPRRRCPALGSRCDNESSAKEPVRAPFGWGGGGGGLWVGRRSVGDQDAWVAFFVAGADRPA